MPPRSASRAFILGSARAVLVSRLSLSMISAGVSWRADAGPRARLVARQEIATVGNVGEPLQARRGGHRQWAQPAGPNVLDTKRACCRT